MPAEVQFADRFVGRAHELEQLRRAVRAAAEGHGGLVLVEGPPGSGKDSLVDELERQIQSSPEFENAAVGTGFCEAISGAQDPYQPFREILRGLVDERKAKTRSVVLGAIGKVAPELAGLVPGVGGLLKAAAEGARSALTQRADDTQTELVMVGYAETFKELATHYRPLVLTVGDAQWIDAPSCRLLIRLAREIAGHALLIILTSSPSNVADSSPFRETRNLLLDNFGAAQLELQGFTPAEVTQYLRNAFGDPLNEQLAAWLADQCGHPGFLKEYVKLLLDRGAISLEAGHYVLHGKVERDSAGAWLLSGPLADLAPPPDVKQVLQVRMSQLTPGQRAMLQIGSVEGRQFTSAVLVELLKHDESEVLQAVETVVERFGFVRNQPSADHWLAEKTAVFGFESQLWRDAFYEQVHLHQRVRFHTAVAVALLKLIPEGDRPRRLDLVIARHYGLGGQPAEAARILARAADSAFGEGGFAEAEAIARQGLEQIRSAGGQGDADTTRARLALRILAASEIRWRGRPDAGSDEIAALLEEGLGAALRANDSHLQSALRILSGSLRLTLRDLSGALAELQEAERLAVLAQEPAAEFAARSQRGHQLVKLDVAAGISLQRQALDFYARELAAPGRAGPALQREALRTLGQLGLGEFDAGELGTAREDLNGAVAGLRALRPASDLGRLLIFQGQVETAAGAYEVAEAALREAIAIFDDPEPLAWRAYGVALLGKTFLEQGRVNDAAAALERGWAETQATWTADLGYIVGNYYAELLLEPGPARDLAKAETLLREALAATASEGLIRSAIAARSLLARVLLAAGRADEAFDHSAAATAQVRERGMVSALRMEEIYFTHYQVCSSIDKREEAAIALSEARRVLQRKADSLRAEADRKVFMERVRLNHSISTAPIGPG